MLEDRAPVERCINSYIEPFDCQITPFNCFDFQPSVKEFCEMHKNRPKLRIGKTIFLGDVGVGKTSIISRFREELFDYDCKTTIGVDIHLEGFDILGLPFNLQIWDTAGQERFKCISSPYFRGTSVVTLVFDLSNLKSLSHCEQWLDQAFKEHSSNQLPYVLLVGNKLDNISLPAYDINQEIAAGFSKKLKAEYWAVSSKTGKNINNFFHRLAFLAFEHVILRELNHYEEQCQPNIKLHGSFEDKSCRNVDKRKCSC